jgi:hypothetical protein
MVRRTRAKGSAAAWRYRHGMDVDATGTQLAMGSITGTLWTSDDGGETWQLANAHRPPIYVTRFV